MDGQHIITIEVSETWVSVHNRSDGRIVFQGDKAFLRDRAIMAAIVERILGLL